MTQRHRLALGQCGREPDRGDPATDDDRLRRAVLELELVPDVRDRVDVVGPRRIPVATAVTDRQHAGPGSDSTSARVAVPVPVPRSVVRVRLEDQRTVAVRRSPDRFDGDLSMESGESLAFDHVVGEVQEQRQRRTRRVPRRRPEFALAAATLGERLQTERLGTDVLDERRSEFVHLAGRRFPTKRRQ